MTINLGTINATVDGDHLTGETKVEAQAIELLADLRAQATRRVFALPDDAAYFAQAYKQAEDGSGLEAPFDCIVRQLIERAIIRRAVTDLLAMSTEDGAAYVISVWDGEDHALKLSRDVAAIMGAIMSTDEDALIVRRLRADRPTTYHGSVNLVYGNGGWDVISDYHTCMEGELANANALADALGDLL